MVYYKIVEYDIEGEFKCHRRYTDFDTLRETWKKRLPGLFIPSLPPKKSSAALNRLTWSLEVLLLSNFYAGFTKFLTL